MCFLGTEIERALGGPGHETRPLPEGHAPRSQPQDHATHPQLEMATSTQLQNARAAGPAVKRLDRVTDLALSLVFHR